MDAASKKTGPVFVTTLYGAAYAPFLAPHLSSIARQRGEQAEAVVLWQDLPRSEISTLSLAYPWARFVETHETIGGDLHQRIPRKMHAWLQAAQMYPDRKIAFLDCDAVVVGDVLEYFADATGAERGGWDITFTWKDEVFPINTGVMLARSGEVAAVVFRAMIQRIEQVVKDKSQLGMALGSSGAADQFVLREMVGFCNYDRTAIKEVVDSEGTGGVRRVAFRGVPCRQLNEINCGAITPEVRVIHYKTGWHPILLEGKDFTANRPKTRCAEMFAYWHELEAESARESARLAVFASAERARAKFEPIADGYEERGILQSEMLAVCGVCEALDVDVVIESGRARGQSTLTMARYFAGSKTRIVSLEWLRDADAEFAEQRLAAYKHVELQYGNAHRLLPQVLEQLAGLRVAVVLDGPKGQEAIELIAKCFAGNSNGSAGTPRAEVVAGFIHDMRQGTSQRATLSRPLQAVEAAVSSGTGGATPRVFFTDDPAYCERFGGLDCVCLPKDEASITVHSWRPFKKGHEESVSYGPTLAVWFPVPARTATQVQSAPAKGTAAGSAAGNVAGNVGGGMSPLQKLIAANV